MENLTLKELKERNEAESNVNTIADEEVTQEVETADDTTDDMTDEVAETEDDSSDDTEGDTETEVEDWMQAEETETSDGEKKGFVPNHGVAAVKKKLKAKLEKKDSELEELKAQVEALKSGQQVQATQPNQGLPPRPKREDFDYDDDAYDAAIDEWNDKRFEAKLNNHATQSTQKATQEAQKKKLEQAIETHYDNAAKLVSSGKVTEDAYLAADRTVRSSLDEMFKGQGDHIADRLINTLTTAGEGSEKVMYQLGISSEKRNKLLTLMSSDPSGLSASVYLGTLQAAIGSKQKRRNTGPKPATKVTGDGGGKGPSGTLHKKYLAAGNDVQARITLKRQAKASGVDVSQW